VSTLGIGGEVAVGLSQRSMCASASTLSATGTRSTKDGATYKGTLDLRSAQATYDIFPVHWFHVSPGVLLYSGNKSER